MAKKELIKVPKTADELRKSDMLANVSLRQIEEELLRREQMKRWQLNPLLWYVERMGGKLEDFKWSTHPEYENHIWDGDVDPIAKAWKDVAYKKWVGIESATGTGKTFFLARLVLWFLDVYEDSLVVTSAPKQDQLKMHLWAEIGRCIKKFQKIRPDAELLSLRLKVDNRPDSSLDEDEVAHGSSWQAVGFVAGVKADEDSATKAQGFHRANMLIIMEECTGIPTPIMTAFQNTCTGENNIIVAVGNPDNEHDTLHQFCIQQNVNSYRISALDYPNIVIGKEVIAGAVTRKSIEDRKIKYGEGSNLYLSRIKGISPKQSIDSLIRIEWILQCIGNSDLPPDDTYNAVGVDVSNSDFGDKSALCWGVGNRLVAVQEFQCPNATHLAYNLMYNTFELERKNYLNFNTLKLSDYDIQGSNIGVDGVGVGVATVNAFVEYGYNCISLVGGQWDVAILKDLDGKPMYRFANLRSQMYWELREDLRAGKISITINDGLLVEQIKKELTVPKVDYSNGYVSLESKEAIKRRLGGKSPNVADAIAYWNWVRKGYKGSNGVLLNLYGGED